MRRKNVGLLSSAGKCWFLSVNQGWTGPYKVGWADKGMNVVKQWMGKEKKKKRSDWELRSVVTAVAAAQMSGAGPPASCPGWSYGSRGIYSTVEYMEMDRTGCTSSTAPGAHSQHFSIPAVCGFNRTGNSTKDYNGVWKSSESVGVTQECWRKQNRKYRQVRMPKLVLGTKVQL